MGYWSTLHLFDDNKFYKEVVPALKGESGDLAADCLEFLKFHVLGGTSRLSPSDVNTLVEQTVGNIIAIANSLDPTFRIQKEYHNINGHDEQNLFLNQIHGHYDFCKFFEYYIFKTCSDFFPHLALGKDGVSRNFELSVKTLSYAIIEELDDWNGFLCAGGTGITNWITHEDIRYLYLDKEHLHFSDNKRAESFMMLLEVAHDHKLGLIEGVDMSENRLELLPGHKVVAPGAWTNEHLARLYWER